MIPTNHPVWEVFFPLMGFRVLKQTCLLKVFEIRTSKDMPLSISSRLTSIDIYVFPTVLLSVFLGRLAFHLSLYQLVEVDL